MSLGLYLNAAWQRSIIDILRATGDRDFMTPQCGVDDKIWHRGTAFADPLVLEETHRETYSHPH